MDKTFLLTLNISFNICILLLGYINLLGAIFFIFISYKYNILLFPLSIHVSLYLINVYNYAICYHIFCKYCKRLTIMLILYDCRLFMPVRDDK